MFAISLFFIYGLFYQILKFQQIFFLLKIYFVIVLLQYTEKYRHF